jgi:hypothetical protein
MSKNKTPHTLHKIHTKRLGKQFAAITKKNQAVRKG